MKKCLVVLTAIVALVLFVPTASASFFECGSVGSVVGTTPYSSSSTFAGGAAGPVAVWNAGASAAQITCNAITVPVGYTLTGIDLYLKDDAENPSGLNSGVSDSWSAVSGVSPLFVQTITTLSTDSINFNECNGTVGVIGSCPIILSYSESIAAGLSSPVIVVDVQSSAVNGGVANTGNDSATLYIQFDESSGVPEPGTLSLMGGALLGLGLFARKLARR